jgi:hypothetical protein
MPLVAALRSAIGNITPFGHQLEIVHPSPLPNFAPNTNNTALAVPLPGFWETLGAPLWWWGETAQILGPNGLRSYVPLVFILFLAWLALAYLGGWRKPPVIFLVLLAVQGFGATYCLVSFRSPARTLKTPFTAFDFHTHTTYSSGVMSPQQQIDWHRARGYKGLAFTDTDRMLPENEFAGLQASNPDMLLLNGCEYRDERHIVFLGIKKAIAAKEFDLAGALREGRRQNAIIIAPHPWDHGESNIAEFISADVNGIEAWNGRVFSRTALDLAKQRNRILLASTDTISKSGSRCYSWTLLPRGMDDTGDILRALRLGKAAIAVTSSAFKSPENWDTEQYHIKKLHRPFVTFAAVAEAWDRLTRAEKACATLGWLALAAFAWAWGAQSEKKTFSLAGPQRVVGFLRRRRLQGRAPGFLFMLMAWVGSVLAVIYSLSWDDKIIPGLGPIHMIAAWLVLDALYLYGRSLWHRVG